ncbi:hypothetical protein Bbelb_128150 [Branchiostoma belcheri]|nr:hypothetical protein Bbelb_128150 [Branchiostoma belcheri]
MSEPRCWATNSDQTLISLLLMTTRQHPFDFCEEGAKSRKTDQCRQVWQQNRGVAVTLKGGSTFHAVSMGGNGPPDVNVAMMFYNSDISVARNNQSNTTTGDLLNVTCIRLTTHHTYQSYFSASRRQMNQKTCLANSLDVHQTSSPSSHTNSIEVLTPTQTNHTESAMTSTMTILLPKLSTTTSHSVKEDLPKENALIPVLVGTSAIVLFLSLAMGLLLKKLQYQNVQDNNDPMNTHIWVMPNVSTPVLLRSGSLPVVSPIRRETPRDKVSRRSLPAVLSSIEPTYAEIPDHVAAALQHAYSEIPDHIAAAQRPLPGLPHTYRNIPENAILQLRSASLPTARRIGGDGTASCTSLPAALQQPSGCDVAYDDTDDGPIQFYAAAAEVSLPVLTMNEENVQTYRQNSAFNSNRSSTGRYNAECVTFRARGGRRQGGWRLNRLYQPASQGERTHVNAPADVPVTIPKGQDIVAVPPTFPNTYWPWEIPGEGTCNTPRRASLPTVTPSNTYWPWEIPGEGTCNTPRRASLSTVTLPNTYWPWEIPGEGTCNTPRRASLPTVTPSNTYWPWEIPGEGTCNTPRRASLSTVTLPNTYWPWEIPGEGTCNTPRRASLPTVTPSNTYWPWEIPGEGTCNTPRRASLSTVTLPNTYWSWEIPGEGTRNTPRRASLSTVTLPNTYWPWEIPGEGTRNTPRRASLSTVTLPNTYWPWEIPGEGPRNTQRRASLPTVTLPNTYWPWEIPWEGTRNTPRRASLSTVTLPNTYWPWEIPGEGTRNTPRRASLPTVTPPNTYWPWEIPGEGPRNTQRRASLPIVIPSNTYWPWEIPGEGTCNTPRRASLSTVTLPNTYWPWEIPGEGPRNTQRRASLPIVIPSNTYWPWEIPGEGPRNTPRRASLPIDTLPNTYWPWEIPGEGTRNTPRRASLPTATLPINT